MAIPPQTTQRLRALLLFFLPFVTHGQGLLPDTPEPKTCFLHQIKLG
jgi:hypothetical protein